MYGARCQSSRNSLICLIPGEFCIEHCSTCGCGTSLSFYMLRYIYMFIHDDVYDALNPTPMCHIRRVIVLNYSTFRCRIVITICIVITLESDNPMCSVLLFD